MRLILFVVVLYIATLETIVLCSRGEFKSSDEWANLAISNVYNFILT